MAYDLSNNFDLESTSRDSGISSFSSDCNDSLNNSLHFDFDHESSTVSNNVNVGVQKESSTFKIKFLGEQQLSRRHTPYMIPWIVEEIKSNGEEYDVDVSVEKSSKKHDQIILKVINDSNLNVYPPNKFKHINLEHHLNNLTRFSKSSLISSHFSYLYRDSPDIPFTCFVFDAVVEKIVDNIFYAIHNAMLSSPLTFSNDSSSPPVTGCQNEEDNHRFEVIYIGKIVVATKKATPSFIDEAVKKFQELGRWDKFSKDLTDCINISKRENAAKVSYVSSDSGCKSFDGKNKMACIMESQDEDKANDDSSINELKPEKDNDVKKSPFFNLASSLDSFKLKSLLGSKGTSDETKAYDHVQNNSTKTDINNNNQNYTKENHKAESISGTIIKECSNCEISCNGHHQLTTFEQEQPKKLEPEVNFDKECSSKKQIDKNKHSYLVVGRDYLTLWPFHQSQPTQEWKFKNISFCSQGVIYSNHIGFIARSNENNKYTCFIFKCPSESSVDEMMMTIKKAFQDALDRCSRHHVVCELCPMHQLHKLCLLLENKDDKYIYSSLLDRITYLEHCYKLGNHFDQKLTYDVPTLHDTNVHMMSCLLKLCDKQQQFHTHVNDSKNNNSSNFMLYPSEIDQEKLQFKKKDESGSESNEVVFGSNYSLLSYPAIEDMDNVYNTTKNHWKVDGCSNKIKLRRHSVPYTLPVCRRNIPDDPSPDINLSPIRKKMVMMVNDGDVVDGRKLGEGDFVLIDKMIPYDSPIRSMFNKVGSHHGNVMTGNKPYLKHIGKSNSTSSSSSLSSILSPRLSLESALKTNTNTISKYRGAWQINVISMIKNTNLVDDENGMDDTQEDRRFHPRSTWKKAIGDTILLIKINKKNQRNLKDLEIEDFDGIGKRVNYEEVTPCLKGVKKLWKQLLDTDLWRTIKLDRKILIRSVRDGVPKEMRGQIWKMLVHQNRLHVNANINHKDNNNIESITFDSAYNYNAVDYELLKNQLTTHQHAILIDLGRTFPNHPYFSSASGPGQASLFNILKAYSVLDVEVGYCQGLSFVAGVLLIHVGERDAFDLLKHLMFELGFRRQYRPDMVPLQIRMYQLTRMLHDSYKDLFDHLDKHQIAPTLYAAPWFLTIFASQFPLGFVARVFDLILMHGTEIIIKVALILLDNHRELIKQCCSFEHLVEFLKVTLPDMAIIQMERIFNQVYNMDITKSLEAYEMEYHILHEEASRPCNNTQNESSDKLMTRLTRVQLVNDSLRRQKMELLDQLQIARRQIRSLEEENCLLSSNEMKLKSQNQILELERKALLKRIDQLNAECKKCITDHKDIATNAQI